MTGAAVQWLRDELGLIPTAADIGPLAASVPDAGGVYLVPAFVGLGSPWWDARARGTIVGLTRGTGTAQLARAVVEAMAYQTRDVVDSMAAASGQTIAELRVDGVRRPWTCCCRSRPTSWACRWPARWSRRPRRWAPPTWPVSPRGVWASTDDVARAWQLDLRCEPAADREAVDAAHARWLRAVERSRDWA